MDESGQQHDYCRERSARPTGRARHSGRTDSRKYAVNGGATNSHRLGPATRRDCTRWDAAVQAKTTTLTKQVNCPYKTLCDFLLSCCPRLLMQCGVAEKSNFTSLLTFFICCFLYSSRLNEPEKAFFNQSRSGVLYMPREHSTTTTSAAGCCGSRGSLIIFNLTTWMLMPTSINADTRAEF